MVTTGAIITKTPVAATHEEVEVENQHEQKEEEEEEEDDTQGGETAWTNIHLAFTNIEQLARTARIWKGGSTHSSTALACLKEASMDILQQLSTIKSERTRLQRIAHARERQVRRKQQRLDITYTVVQLDRFSTGPARMLWEKHILAMDTKRRTLETKRVLMALIDCVVYAATEDGEEHTAVYRRWASQVWGRAMQRRTTFYVCSGALEPGANGVCRTIDCTHAGRQAAGVTHVRKDVVSHVRRVHRVSRASDGYEGCGFLDRRSQA